jgi:GntR family transcriptional repressor for pyruvate dehydrogenase complex
MKMEYEQSPSEKNKEIRSQGKGAESSDGVLRRLHVQPIDKLLLTDMIIERIATLMAEGALKPGSVLPSERNVAEMLKVSRPSVRQALRALEILGVLEIRPGSRTHISKSISQLLANPLRFMLLLHDVGVAELFETRKTIEVELAKLAAQNATEEDIKVMQSALSQASGHLSKPRQYLLYEIAFHEAIFKAARNRLMEAMMTSIGKLLFKTREETVLLFADLEESLERHIRIFEAIKQRDIEAAGDAMFNHLSEVEKKLIEAGKELFTNRKIQRFF